LNVIGQIVFAGAPTIFAGALPLWAPPWRRGWIILYCHGTVVRFFVQTSQLWPQCAVAATINVVYKRHMLL